jgi:hypothetical protein
MDSIALGLERENEELTAYLSDDNVSFKYKKTYDNGITGKLLNTGNHQLYNYINYKNFQFIFDNNKLDRWTMYYNGETILRKYPNCIYNKNQTFTNSSQESLIDINFFNNLKNINDNESENQSILDCFIHKYHELFSKINNKDKFQENLLCYIDSAYENTNNVKLLLQRDFKDLLLNFINAENDNENKHSIFTIKTLQEKFSDLKFLNENNLLQECINSIINNENIFDIFYSREEIFYTIYDAFQNRLIKAKEKSIKKYFNNKNFDEFSKTYSQTFKNDTIIKLTEEKEERFVRYKAGKIELTKDELLEYNLIYSVVMDIYKSKLFNKKTNKPKPTFLNLDKKCDFAYKIIDCLCSNSVINDNDILNENQDFNECAKALFQLDGDD